MPTFSSPSASPSPNSTAEKWRQGELVEIDITDLTDGGEGVGRFEQRVVFVPDTVPGDRVLVRLVQVKPQYANAKLINVISGSAQRIRPRCIVADKCGGCQWQHIDYAYQLKAKRNQVIQALERIGGFSEPPVEMTLGAEDDLAYRNKSTYPLGRSRGGQVQAGYYQKGSHDLINLNQCPIQDVRLNPLLAEVKQDIYDRGWGIYDEKQHRGKVRHLSLRVGRRTGEILLTLVAKDANLEGLHEQAEAWLDRYPDLVGVSLNVNPKRTNAIFGDETRHIAGQPYLSEKFAGLQFQIHPTTFFQVYTEQAEALLRKVISQLNLQGNETLIDAYSGIGTFTLPLAKKVKQVIGLEVQPEAIAQAQFNADLNGVSNVSFQVGAVEKVLPELQIQADIVLLDPPRKGCDRAVLDTLLDMQPQRIVYISCKPSTLARDLKILCEDGKYELVKAQPADFFPQTAHVECAAFLERRG